jgi:RecA/RadA recombinase
MSKEIKKEKPPEPVTPKKQGKKDERLSLKEELEIVKARINKRYDGKGALLSGKEFSNIFTLRRPTGITQLDVALAGGWPAGGLSQIIGEEGATKSWLANSTIKHIQNTYGEEAVIAVCMTEMPYDKAFGKWQCGLRIAYSDQEIEMLEQANAARGLPPFTPEQVAWLKDSVGEFQQAIFSTAEQLLETACDLVETNLYQLVLIDSFGALLTSAEAEAKEGLESKHYGGAAGVITQFMHRLHAALNLPDRRGRPNTTTVLGINQYRENLKASGPYANPLNIAGGRALKHGKLVDLLLEKGSKIWVDQGGVKHQVGREISWSLLKGKAGCHDGPRGKYSFYYGESGYGFGVDIYQDLLIAGVSSGVIKQSGSWYSYDGKNLFQGQNSSAEFFLNNIELVDVIRQSIFKQNGIRFITKESF